ncbi:hypothetical protein [Streptomyces sp. NPDC048282]|uniref:hypothetical protein n=1 Tax=Streptomyces sp. NPDC048282 TaxID=3365528 RepID=UPI003715324F
MTAEPGRDREHPGGDRADLARHLAGAVDPGGAQLQGFGEGGDTALAHAVGAGPRAGGEPVDLVEAEARVRDRGQAGVDGQGERVDHETAAHA